MDAYDEFIEPTRVSHTEALHFISSAKRHLVVGKSSLLQVFEPVKSGQNHRLNLIAQFKLHGTITGLKKIRTKESALDYLLVSTRFAKVSLVKWDHKIGSLQTVSLHYYEDAIQNSSYETFVATELLVEPRSSCMCLRFKNLLTFLPFSGDDDDEDEDEEKPEEKPDDIYAESFLINGQDLDSRIGNIIHMDFLHNYRVATLGILCSQKTVWAGNAFFGKDNISYIVLSLDLNTKSSTTVLKVDNLPYDLETVIPLPSPLNGALLVGANHIIHVDNGGITRKLAVNQYSELITNGLKNFADYSALNLRFENSSATPLPHDNKVLFVLKDGSFVYVNFEMDGKSIKRVSLELVPDDHKDHVQLTFPGPIAALDHSLLFMGNQNGDSPLVECYYDINKKKPTQETVEDDDEDIYEVDGDAAKTSFNRGPVKFRLHDTLINNGPISSFTTGFYETDKFKSNLINPNYQEVSIFANGGSGQQSALNIFTPSIAPNVKSSLTFSTINKLWITNEFLITSDDTNSKSEIFHIKKNYAQVTSKHFVNTELTIGIHELNNGKFIMQVTPKKIVIFDQKMKRKMTLKEAMKDSKDDEIFNSFCSDEILMIFMASGEVKIFAINTYNDTVTKIDIPKLLTDTLITTGYISNSNILNAVSKDVNLLIKSKGVKRKLGSAASLNSENNEKDLGPMQKVFILVTGDNRIVMFNRFHNERCYQLNDIDKFSDVLQLAFFEKREAIPDPCIKQVVFNEIGDSVNKTQYLTLLTMGGEVHMYKLYFDGENFKFLKEKNLLITGAPHNSYSVPGKIERKLFYVENINGYTGIFVSGEVPYFVMKTHHSIPRIFKFSRIPIMSFGKFSDDDIVFLDDQKNARICDLPKGFNYDNNWPVKKIAIGETIKSVTYHQTSNTVVLSTYKEIPYNCMDEEGQPIAGTIADKPPATSFKGSIKLVSPMSWTVIDEFELQDNEVGMNVKSMLLDVVSSTRRFKNKKELIVIGTGKYRLEDLAANGAFKVYEIIDIIPEPGKPETNHKFKEVYQEDTKGAVTTITEVSGRFLVSQGQKIIIRDLQDDGVVPVAFLDCSVYVSESKSFGNLILLGDTLKSVWLVGFDAEPFRMIMMGKDLKSLDVSCADFIVKDEEIYILVGDNNNVLHLLKYDPEDPASSNGQRLVAKASFNLNTDAACFKTIPCRHEANSFQVVGSTIEGSFFAVRPLSELNYRRLYILQQQLTDREYHVCGLNPRLNRFGGLKFAANDANTKPILDYELVRGFAKLNDDRKRAIAAKVSRDQGEIWKDLVELEAGLM